MAGLKLPGARTPKIAASEGIPTPGQPTSLRPGGRGGIPAAPAPKAPVINARIVQPLALPKQRTTFHTSTAIPRGHRIGTRLVTPYSR